MAEPAHRPAKGGEGEQSPYYRTAAAGRIERAAAPQLPHLRANRFPAIAPPHLRRKSGAQAASIKMALRPPIALGAAAQLAVHWRARQRSKGDSTDEPGSRTGRNT